MNERKDQKGLFTMIIAATNSGVISTAAGNLGSLPIMEMMS